MSNMTLPSEIWPLLKKHSLMAYVVNEGWMLIRRKSYIDVYIKEQPYNSVEVLFHMQTKVRMPKEFPNAQENMKYFHSISAHNHTNMG